MPERVITLAISDADWKALRAVQPEPVDWLKRTIRAAIDQSAPLSRADAGPERPAVKAADAAARPAPRIAVRAPRARPPAGCGKPAASKQRHKADLRSDAPV